MSKSKRCRHPVFVEVPKIDDFKLPILFISRGKRSEHPVEVITNVPAGTELIEARFLKDGPNRNIRFFMRGGANLFVTIDGLITHEDAAQTMMTFEGASRYKLFLI